MTYAQEKKLIAAIRADLHYQELLLRCTELESDYIQIKCSLSEENQDKLDLYIAACEELEYRRTVLAYALGTQDGIMHSAAQLRAD